MKLSDTLHTQSGIFLPVCKKVYIFPNFDEKIPNMRGKFPKSECLYEHCYIVKSVFLAFFYTFYLEEFCLFLDSAYAGKFVPQLLLKQSDTLHTQYTLDSRFLY